MSRPKRPRITRSGTASQDPTAASSGLEARKPMMPPAARMAFAPPGGSGMPSAMWTRPQAAKARTTVPMASRLVASRWSGPRRTWRPKASRTSGTAYATVPKVPAKTAWTMLPKKPGRPHHSRAATTTARAISARPRPSRLCSGSRSRPAAPTLRTALPVTLAMPIQVVRKARKGSGRPPPWGFLAPLRGADRVCGRRFAGRELVPPRARVLEDVRVAMMAGYVIVTPIPRSTRAPATGARTRQTAAMEFWLDLGRRHADGGVERQDLGRPVTTR